MLRSLIPPFVSRMSWWLLLIGGLVACGWPPAAQPGEIRIGLITVLTGGLSDVVGTSTVNGVNLAIRAVNDAGGLDVAGRKYLVTLFTEDDQDKAELATSAAQKLINQDKVVALISPTVSRNAIPVAEVAENARIASISPQSTNPATTANKRYAFRVAFVDPFQGRVLARFARDELKAQKAAVLYDIASAYNKGIAEVFKQVFTDGGGQVVAFESYTTGEKDFSPHLTHIKASGASILFLPNHPDEVPLQAQQARRMGIKATLLGADAWGSIDAVDLVELEGSFFSTVWSPELQSEQSQAFVEAYRKTYGKDPLDTAASAYDAIWLVLEAIKGQGTVAPEDIRNGLANSRDFAGVTGTISYQGTGDPVKSAVISQIRGGKVALYTQVNP